MIQIVKGKRYDTDKATLVAEWDNLSDHGVQSYSDFRYYKEKLFISNKGSWFLFGSGNFSTSYRNDKIVPISSEEAMDWLEERQETGAIEKYFRETIVDA